MDRLVRRAGATRSRSSCSTAVTASCTEPRCSDSGCWPEALVEARHACDRLAAPVNPMALGGACAIEGDLLRLSATSTVPRPRTTRHEFGRDPQPGLSLLRFGQGRVDAADAMIRRVLDEPRIRCRAPGPRALRRDRARRRRRRRGAPRRPTSSARSRPSSAPPTSAAQAARATRRGAPGRRNADAALVELRGAFNEFHDLGVPYDAARTRLLLADACEAVGDQTAAEMEAVRPARDPRPASPGAESPSRSRPPTGSPPRELEVLVLLAGGKTNRVIAQELYISEKTVASHVSHIFTKLGVTSAVGRHRLRLRPRPRRCRRARRRSATDH